MLGLHDRSMVLEFNDHRAVVVEQSDFEPGRHVAGFDLDKLTLKDTRQLLDLTQETRTVPIEGVQRVVIKTTKIELSTGNTITNTKMIDNIDTVDIEFEEMPDRVVDRFKDITPEKETEEFKDGPKIIDIVGDIESKSVEVKQMEIGDRLNQSAIESFKQKLKEQKEQRRAFDSDKK